MDPLMQKLGSDIWAYYAGLDPVGQGALKAFVWIMSLAFLTNIVVRILGTSKKEKEEDPFMVVLSEPVGLWVDRSASKAPLTVKKPAVKGRMMFPLIRPPSFKAPNHRPQGYNLTFHKPTTPGVSPTMASETEQQASEKATQPVSESTPDEIVAEPFDQPAQRPSAVVAEIDFIRAATKDDLMGLRMAFGTIHVPAPSYAQDAALLGSAGLDAGLYLTPVPSEPDGLAYASVSAGKRLGAVVLSDSQNLRRVCMANGIPSWSLHEWRLLSPRRC